MNGLGMAVTKYASSTSRVTLSQAKTILVWLFFLIIPTFTNIKGETFSFLQLGGFVVMLIGIVIYNEIVSIPFLGFSDSTKANLEKRKLRAKSLNYNEDTIDEAEADLMTNDASDYAASSPKAYDYQKPQIPNSKAQNFLAQRNYKRLQNQMSEKAGGSSADSYFKIEDE